MLSIVINLLVLILLFTCLFLVIINSILSARDSWVGRGRGPWEIVLPPQLEKILEETLSIVKKAQQRLYFLRQLRKFNLPQELLKQFYSAIIESVLCTSITVWFSSAIKSDLRRLQRVVRTAERNHWYKPSPLSKNYTYPE